MPLWGGKRGTAQKPKAKKAAAGPNTPAPSKKRKTAVEDTPLLELIEEEDKKIPKRPRSENSKWNKMIYDNLYCHGFSDEEVRMAQSPVEKDYLLDRLAGDRQKWIDGNISMGGPYWKSVREEFRDPNSPFAKLEPPNPDEEKDPALFEALCGIHSEKRDMAPWEEFTRECDAINSLGACGVLRGLLMVPVKKSLDNARIVCDGLELTVRLGVNTKFTETWKLATPHFIDALVKLLQGYHSEDMTTKEWWVDIKHYAKSILPEAAMDVVVDRKKDWAGVREDVDAVYVVPVLGEKLVGKVKRQLEAESCGAIVEKHVAILVGKDLTSQVLATNRKHFIATCKARGIDVMKPWAKKKQVSAMYNTVAIKEPATSPIDQYNFSIDAFVRGLAVRLGELVPLWSEQEVSNSTLEAGAKVTIHPSLLRAAKSTRKNLSDHLDTAEASAANIVSALKSKDAFFRKNDRGWRVDHAFWIGCCGIGASARVEAAVGACFKPLAGGTATEAQALANLKALKASKLVAFAGSHVGENMNDVIAWMESLAAGRAPGFKKIPNSGFVNTVLGAMANFAKVELPSGSGGSKKLTGADGVKELWKSVKDKDADGVDLEAVKYVCRFHWVLEPAEREKAQTMLDKVVAKTPAGIAVIAAAKAKVKKTTVDTRAMVDALFSSKK